jgi:excisionase family DNA binding protein
LDSASFTSHAVARMMGVSASSVLSWIDKGLLNAHRTPGGHRRVQKAALLAFLRQHAIPIPRALVETIRVLVIDGDPAVSKAIRRMLRQHAPDLAVHAADGPIDGLIGIGSLRPDAVVLDAQMPGLDAVQVCSRMRSLPDTAHVVVIALANRPSPQMQATLVRAGAVACLARPPDPAKLLEALRPTRPRDAFL